MAPPRSIHGAAAASKFLKVLTPSGMHQMRVYGELARILRGVGTARVISPFGKVCCVEVVRDGNGAILGNGWPEYVSAHGLAAWWFLVLRHEGAGFLTIKVFDTSSCIREMARPLDGNTVHRPQFLKIFLGDFADRMMIPDGFSRVHLGTTKHAVLVGPDQKHYRVELDKEASGKVFFTDGWSRFVTSNGVNHGEPLLFRLDVSAMAFKVKVFGLDGCQREHRQSQFCNISASHARLMKKINTSTIKDGRLILPVGFCREMDLQQRCEIMLRTSAGSWMVTCVASIGRSRGMKYCRLQRGWKAFSRDNGLQEGDMCDFVVVEATLWDVHINRRA